MRVQEYVPAPERRYPSPSAQRRSGEHWKARVGLGFVVILTLCSALVMFRIAGLGVGSAASAFRGTAAPTPARPTAAATVATTGGQTPGSQPAAAPPQATTAPPAPAAAPAPTTAPAPPRAATPTTRPGQREYTVQSGDSLFAIAQRNNTSVDALVAANNLPSRDVVLSVGQRLVIP